MSIRHFLERYIVPGLVIQAVIVGGGYATGRELVEFFISTGPATGMLGMLLTAALFSVGSMVAFELARRHHTFDYKSFCAVYLGRFGSMVFELGYFASLLLVLAVISAAAARLLAEMFGSPELFNATAFLFIVAGLVFFGNRVIERLISAWSVLFYITYLSMFALVWWRFGDAMSAAIHVEPIRWGTALVNGVSYTGYNICVLPILIFADRGSAMPAWLRPAIAAVAMVIAVYFASTIGLIDLIGRGYRYSSAFFLIVFLLPLLTRGTWLVLREQHSHN